MACDAVAGLPTPEAPNHQGGDLELILAQIGGGPEQRQQLFTSLLSVPGHPMSSFALSSITKEALSSVTSDPRECPMIRIYHLIIVWSPSLSGEFIKCYF